jgi:hypothetical protein
VKPGPSQATVRMLADLVRDRLGANPLSAPLGTSPESDRVSSGKPARRRSQDYAQDLAQGCKTEHRIRS